MTFRIHGAAIRRINSPYSWIDNISDNQILDLMMGVYKSIYHDRLHWSSDIYNRDRVWFIDINVDFIDSLMRPFSRKDTYFLPVKSPHLSLILLDQLQCPSDINAIPTLDDTNFILECSHDDAMRYKLMF